MSDEIEIPLWITNVNMGSDLGFAGLLPDEWYDGDPDAIVAETLIWPAEARWRANAAEVAEEAGVELVLEHPADVDQWFTMFPGNRGRVLDPEIADELWQDAHDRTDVDDLIAACEAALPTPRNTR